MKIGNRKLKIGNIKAFTLIELLVVISIIGIIAAFLLPVAGAVKRNSAIHTAQTEMAQLETAIDRYKAAYGFYPPDSTTTFLNGSGVNIPINQLYYELEGTVRTNIGGVDCFVLFDGSAQINVNPPGDVNTAFGVTGFVNCSKTNADESTTQARNFLPDLKPRQIGTVTIPPGVAITNLVTSVGGPDPTYRPLNLQDVNPWRYNSSNPTNNPGSYDLWVQLSIAGGKYLICNWSKQVQNNNPLP